MDLLQTKECWRLRKIVNTSMIVCADVFEEGRYYYKEGTNIEFAKKGKVPKVEYIV
jgi:hypothetical protein